MTLVDTSVWINHFRRADPRLTRLLADGQVVTHPFVIGELSCGRLANRDEVLRLLERLPTIEVVSHREARALLDTNGLAGTGLGWVDVHLLAAARLGRVTLLTADKALGRAAQRD